jgi:hypothetical protein
LMKTATLRPRQPQPGLVCRAVGPAAPHPRRLSALLTGSPPKPRRDATRARPSAPNPCQPPDSPGPGSRRKKDISIRLNADILIRR